MIGLVGVSLILSGILQKIAAERNQSLKTKENLCLKDSILLGIAQGFSIIPGISRSGITSSAFLFLGISVSCLLTVAVCPRCLGFDTSWLVLLVVEFS